jgi:putative AbiEi antitoxin of type IV toxin-antitoxin system/uncharacterized protein DUF559
MSGRSAARGADWSIAAFAHRQHGVVARSQLLDAGLTGHAIDHRVRRGRLHLVHRGVYAVGHGLLTAEGRWMAATLAAGPKAVLSHRAAASAWLLMRSSHLEVTGTVHRSRPGIQIYRSRLPAEETTTLRGIPLTTVPRTLLDLAAVLPAHQVERAANEAQYRGHRDRLSLADMVERYPRRHGIGTIKQILARFQAGTTITRSELESRFLDFLRTTGLPLPSLNTWLHLRDRWIECDCVWQDQRLVVELDGHAAHHTTTAFERDRARDRALTTNGWRTVRVTWRQLHQEPEGLAADLRRILAVCP